MGFLSSVLCSGHPMDKNKPHIFAYAAETCFCYLKSNFPLNLKVSTSNSMWKEDLLNDTIYTPVNSCWTRPFRNIVRHTFPELKKSARGLTAFTVQQEGVSIEWNVCAVHSSQLSLFSQFRVIPYICSVMPCLIIVPRRHSMACTVFAYL